MRKEEKADGRGKIDPSPVGKYLVTQFGKLFRKQEVVSRPWRQRAEEMIDR